MREAEGRGLDRVVLSGGVFQNRLLLEGCARRLRDVGLEVLFPAVLPPNDGGIAYGQVAVAMAREASR
jgi:hydrogenase maturation protein HypF